MIRFFLLISILFSACTESGKQSNSEKQRSQAAAIFLISSGQCAETNAPSIAGIGRTQFDFIGVNCVSTTVGNIGFVQSGLNDRNSNGIAGTTSSSRLAPKRGFSSSGTKKVNVEVSYILSGNDSFLDVTGNGSLNESTAAVTGPTFRIKPSTVTYLIEATGAEGTFGTGTVPSSAVGTAKTLCLEFHEEGAGAHMFGWSKPCADVTDKGTYEFDQENVAFGAKGTNVGFVLNKVSLQRVIVTSGAIGSAKSLQ